MSPPQSSFRHDKVLRLSMCRSLDEVWPNGTPVPPETSKKCSRRTAKIDIANRFCPDWIYFATYLHGRLIRSALCQWFSLGTISSATNWISIILSKEDKTIQQTAANQLNPDCSRRSTISRSDCPLVDGHFGQMAHRHLLVRIILPLKLSRYVSTAKFHFWARLTGLNPRGPSPLVPLQWN